MNRRIAGALVIGVAGVAILIALGVWQVQRLAWKEGVLADLEARIAADPVAVPASPDPVDAAYLPVQADGSFDPGGLRVLASVKEFGPAHRWIGALVLGDGRRVLVDRGVTSATANDVPLPPGGAARVTGNLHWPDEVDGFTPEPDIAANIWYARDVAAMAKALDTEPVLIVARRVEGDNGQITTFPVGTEGIPNDHLEYAITWFSLALVWAVMTGFLVVRLSRARQEENA